MLSSEKLIRDHAQFIVDHEAHLVGIVADGHLMLARYVLDRMKDDAPAPTVASAEKTVPTPLPMLAFVERLDDEHEAAPAPIAGERSDGIPEESGDIPTKRAAYVGHQPVGKLAVTGMLTLADAVQTGMVPPPPPPIAPPAPFVLPIALPEDGRLIDRSGELRAAHDEAHAAALARGPLTTFRGGR